MPKYGTFLKKQRQIKLFLFFKFLILSIFTQIIAKNCENEHFCSSLVWCMSGSVGQVTIYHFCRQRRW